MRQNIENLRSAFEKNDPAPAVARVEETIKIYPYQAGGFGNSVVSYLTGKAPLGKTPEPKTPRFVKGPGMQINTVDSNQ